MFTLIIDEAVVLVTVRTYVLLSTGLLNLLIDPIVTLFMLDKNPCIDRTGYK